MADRVVVFFLVFKILKKKQKKNAQLPTHDWLSRKMEKEKNLHIIQIPSKAPIVSWKEEGGG